MPILEGPRRFRQEIETTNEDGDVLLVLLFREAITVEDGRL